MLVLILNKSVVYLRVNGNTDIFFVNTFSTPTLNFQECSSCRIIKHQFFPATGRRTGFTGTDELFMAFGAFAFFAHLCGGGGGCLILEALVYTFHLNLHIITSIKTGFKDAFKIDSFEEE